MVHDAQAGLVGNRAIPAASLWNVVLAMERAFPVLMGPGVDAVRPHEDRGQQVLCQLWIQQV